MIDLPQSVRVAVCQLAPILFDKASTVQKTIEVIDEAARHGAELVVFPESFIPAYPRGLSFGYVVGSRSMEGRYDWKRYYDNS
ncbi:MAG TPA: nitrilase, partial [Methanocorpusculum sp.]|nr:nitrilase [Methanocorpusculum sp.]